MKYLEHILTIITSSEVVLTVVLVGAILLTHWLLRRWVLSLGIRHPQLRRRWIVQVRNLCLALAVVGLAMVWANELKDAALSLAAILVALVIATKEIILCVTGSLIKLGTRAFTVGDRIRVGDISGDVIDQTLLTTTLMETGPLGLTHQHTSRSIVLPNSVFWTQPIVNESFTEDYVLHVFTITVAAEGWEQAEQKLLSTARSVCAEYLDDARRHIARIVAREGLEIPPVDPRVILTLPEPGKVNLVARVPAPARRRGEIEQRIIRGFLSTVSKPV
jgi:small-conductance mechanosensitive channel